MVQMQFDRIRPVRGGMALLLGAAVLQGCVLSNAVNDKDTKSQVSSWMRPDDAQDQLGAREHPIVLAKYGGEYRNAEVEKLLALIVGRLYAEFAKTAVIATLMVLLALPFGIHIEGGILGFVVLVILVSLWTMVFSGFMQLIALKSRSAAATQSGSMVFFPLLFLTPNFVPRDLLTRPMEIAATCNPVTYIMEAARSLVLDGFDGAALAKGFGVVAVTMAIMLTLSVRVVSSYD